MRDEAAIRADLGSGAFVATRREARLADDVCAALDELGPLRAAIDAALAVCDDMDGTGLSLCEHYATRVRAALGATTTQTSDERALLETVASRNVCHETGDEIEMRCEYAPGLHRHAWPAAGASTEEPAPTPSGGQVHETKVAGMPPGTRSGFIASCTCGWQDGEFIKREYAAAEAYEHVHRTAGAVPEPTEEPTCDCAGPFEDGPKHESCCALVAPAPRRIKNPQPRGRE